MIWTLLWLVWLLLFTVIEGFALANRSQGDTLSEHIWWLLGRGLPATSGVKLRRLAFLSFAAWLVVHLFSGGWV